MKILQVSHGLPPRENAGVELYTFYLSKALVQLEHQVHIFCREENPNKEEFSSSKEEVDELAVTRVVNNLTKVWNPRTFYDNHFFDRTFSQTLKEERPDIVHFQHFIALSAHLLQMAKEEGSQVVLTLHDYFILCHRIQLLKKDYQRCPGPLYGLECATCLDMVSSPKDVRTKLILNLKDFLPVPFIKWTKRFFIPPRYLDQEGYEVFHRYRFMYEMLKIPEIILTPSQYVKDLFLKYYPFIGSKTFVLPLGMFPEESGVELPRSSKPLNHQIRFCYFGNILPPKGLHILLDAFKMLPKGKAVLTLYGSRNRWTETYYDQLKKQADGFPVDFRGPFKRESLAKALADQDVVVLPSIWPETFSIMIREANMIGLPVIGSRIGAIPEAIQDGVNGLLFEPGNRDDLRRCMLRFIEKPSLIQIMTSRMPKVKSMEEHASELVEIYNRLIEK